VDAVMLKMDIDEDSQGGGGGDGGGDDDGDGGFLGAFEVAAFVVVVMVSRMFPPGEDGGTKAKKQSIISPHPHQMVCACSPFGFGGGISLFDYIFYTSTVR